MRATVMALVFLLIGAAVGGVLAIGFGAGMGAAGGLVMGAQAGVCLAADTARQQGVVNPDTLNRLIADSVAQIRAKSAKMPLDTGVEWVEDASGCAKLLTRFSSEQTPAGTRAGL